MTYLPWARTLEVMLHDPSLLASVWPIETGAEPPVLGVANSVISAHRHRHHLAVGIEDGGGAKKFG